MELSTRNVARSNSSCSNMPNGWNKSSFQFLVLFKQPKQGLFNFFHHSSSSDAEPNIIYTIKFLFFQYPQRYNILKFIKFITKISMKIYEHSQLTRLSIFKYNNTWIKNYQDYLNSNGNICKMCNLALTE